MHRIPALARQLYRLRGTKGAQERRDEQQEDGTNVGLNRGDAAHSGVGGQLPCTSSGARRAADRLRCRALLRMWPGLFLPFRPPALPCFPTTLRAGKPSCRQAYLPLLRQNYAKAPRSPCFLTRWARRIARATDSHAGCLHAFPPCNFEATVVSGTLHVAAQLWPEDNRPSSPRNLASNSLLPIRPGLNRPAETIQDFWQHFSASHTAVVRSESYVWQRTLCMNSRIE